MGKSYFLIGGARSGKSRFSEELAAALSDKVGYLATGQVIDAEMEKRVKIHKERRPKSWRTFEIKKNDIQISDIQDVLLKIKSENLNVLIIDCITNLVFRLIYKYNLDDLEIMDNILEDEIESGINGFFKDFTAILGDAVKTQNLNVIIVSNEVGLGIVPAYPFGRIFRDMLGQANRTIAAASDEVHFFVAGISMRMK